MISTKAAPHPQWLKALLFGAAYFLSAELSWYLSSRTSIYVNFWFPAGIYVAGLLLADTADWAGLILTANVANIGFDLHHGALFAVTLALSFANTAEAMVGAFLFRRLVARTTQLNVLKEFLGLVACSVFFSTALGATIGAAALRLAGYSDSYFNSWASWWIGNAMAILLVAPFMLIWISPIDAEHRWWREPRRLAEAALIVFGLAAISWHLLARGRGLMSPNKAVLIPFILWAALRFGTRGASAINLLLALMVTFLTVHYLKGISPAQVDSGSYIFTLQMYLAVCALVGLIPAIAIGERDVLVRQLGYSEERFRNVIEGSPESIIVQRDGIILYANPAAVRMHGATSARQLLGRRMLDLVHSDFHELAYARRKHIAEHGFGGPMVEIRYLRIDGTAIEVEVQSVGVRFDGAPAIQITAHDISQRREAQEALRESEERYRRLFEAESDAIVVVNCDTGQFVDVNGAASQLYGYSGDEFLQLRAADISSEPIVTEQAIAEHARTVPLRWHRKKDGTVFPVEITGSYFEARGHTFHVAAIRDLTERKRAEAEHREIERRFQESQKLESLGILAGGIAHDFNNILSGIFGFTSLARKAAGGSPELQDYLDEIGRAGRRAAELVRQILAFSRTRNDAAALAPVRLEGVVAEAVKLLRATSPSMITFDVYQEPNLPAVAGDATQLHQVVMNLGTNAVQAMNERPGFVTLRLDACEVDEALARALSGVNAGPFLRLTVRDTGTGMDSKTQGRVFEPFFTTRTTGGGTGLGLSVVHGIVRSHHGAIRLTSEVDRGTTFEVYLPAVASAPAEDRRESLTIARGQGERILFVDDEIAIMNIGKLCLGQLGYGVIAECSVLEALARFEREPETFHLVVTDLSMPDLTGLEFAMRVRELRGDLPVILTTGYSATLTPERLRSAGVREVLEKPYTIDALAATVSRYLPRRQAVRA